VSIDSRVLVFTFAITLLTGLGFGLVPALQASKVNLNETLKDAGRGSTEGGRQQIIRSSLVVLEIALALLLLVGAGLMVKSFVRLQNVDPGFNPNNALTLKISLPRTKYPEPDQQSAFYQELIEKVSVLPGVEAVGAAVVVPLSGDDYVLGFSIKGRPPYPAGTEPSTNYYSVNADYFKAMGGETVRDPTRLVFALDHYVPATSPQTIELHPVMGDFAKQFGITLHEAGEGIGHQLIVETGRALPGGLVPNIRQNGDFKL